MILKRFRLAGWQVYACFQAGKEDADDIHDLLFRIGCDAHHADRAGRMIAEGKEDTGLTYSNFMERETVMVVSRASSPKEFAQSWTHEIGHLVTHIAQAKGTDPLDEDIRYLFDEAIEKTWDVARDFLCDHCLK